MIRDLGRPEKLALVVVAVAMAAGSVMWAIRWTRARQCNVIAGDPAMAAEEGERAQGSSEIIIYIAGAVARPGVYRMSAGSRVFEAIERAGGTLNEASLGSLNLAAPLTDGEMLQIPAGIETDVTVHASGSHAAPDTGTGAGRSRSSDVKVNVNTANARLLECLPGIGPSLATRIIDYRQKNGPFQSIEQLMSVPGIGPKKFADLKDRVTVR